MLVLDVLRRRRNNDDYSGDYMDEETMDQRISEARGLLRDVTVWLQEQHPEML